jgi:hypothetical protein
MVRLADSWDTLEHILLTYKPKPEVGTGHRTAALVPQTHDEPGGGFLG